ncbi:hypothetical protein E2562_027537 [Oryza meyeriana var. granulata]|uniref:Uncharacterized protein n=1 Tax=Oryza meyeriana var. granulata TaxID=110450 RepID=A0A6G1CI35_9ORYZ|nr:hypothetical protein E2562_027537 [Oryza meyeriana var. granulata]
MTNDVDAMTMAATIGTSETGNFTIPCQPTAQLHPAGGSITGDGEEESQMCRRLVPEASLMEMRGGLVDEPWLGLQLVKIVREWQEATQGYGQATASGVAARTRMQHLLSRVLAGELRCTWKCRQCHDHVLGRYFFSNRN